MQNYPAGEALRSRATPKTRPQTAYRSSGVQTRAAESRQTARFRCLRWCSSESVRKRSAPMLAGASRCSLLLLGLQELPKPLQFSFLDPPVLENIQNQQLVRIFEEAIYQVPYLCTRGFLPSQRRAR